MDYGSASLIRPTAPYSRLATARWGFSLIELIIVVAILSVLAGVAVPYYNEHLTSSRIAVLKQNVANLRKVVSDFKGDHGRGPFRVSVSSGATTMLNAPQSNDLNLGSELVAGPIQYNSNDNGNPWRRKNLQYIPRLPVLEDPQTAARLNWSYGTCSAFFVDEGNNGVFDVDDEFWFADDDRNGTFNPSYDTPMSHKSTGLGPADRPLAHYTGSSTGDAADFVKPVDYIDVVCTDTTGVSY